MPNEIVFLLSVFCVSTCALIALRLGKEYLIGFVSSLAVVVNLFVIKQITLLGYTATASDSLAVGITLSLNLMQEYHGKPTAFTTIWVGFFCALFYSLMSIIHLTFIPAPLDTSNIHFKAILAAMPRIIIASLTTYLMVQRLDAQLYGYLKRICNGRFFVMRNYTSLICSQVFDTLLFSFLGLYMISPAYSSLYTLREIIIVSVLIKVAVIAIAVPYVRLAHQLIKTVSTS